MDGLSSFIEFIAAIYVTMSIDNLFENRFWSPDYSKLVKNTFNKLHISNIIVENSLKRIDDVELREANKSRMFGSLMLMVSIALMLFIGFDSYDDSNGIIPISYIALFITMIALALIYLICINYIKKWNFKKTLGTFAFLVVLYISLVIWIIPYLKNKEISLDWISLIWVKSVVFIVLLLPIGWQLFRNWLYSSIYLKYMEDKIQQCYQRYEKAKAYRPNAGIDINSISESYRDIAVNAHDRRDSPDIINGQYLNVLMNEISIIDTPSIINLLKSWGCYQIEYFKQKRERKRHEKFIRSMLNEPINMEVYYKKYQKSKLHLKMSEFCKNENIDLAAFNKYCQQHKKK